VAAIGIAIAMLSALTLLPALLMLTGRAAFWPRRPPKPVAADDGKADSVTETAALTGPYARIGRFVGERPRTVWVVVLVLLLAGASGLTQLRADGVPQSKLILGGSDASSGQQVLAEH